MKNGILKLLGAMSLSCCVVIGVYLGMKVCYLLGVLFRFISPFVPFL